MSRDSDSRPFHVLRLAIWLLLSGVLMVLALLLWGSLQDVPPNLIPPGIAIAVLLLAAGLGLMLYSRRLRRSQRPEWLETRAWKRSLMDKLERGQAHGAGPAPAGPNPRVNPGSSGPSGPGGNPPG